MAVECFRRNNLPSPNFSGVIATGATRPVPHGISGTGMQSQPRPRPGFPQAWGRREAVVPAAGAQVPMGLINAGPSRIGKGSYITTKSAR